MAFVAQVILTIPAHFCVAWSVCQFNFRWS